MHTHTYRAYRGPQKGYTVCSKPTRPYTLQPIAAVYTEWYTVLHTCIQSLEGGGGGAGGGQGSFFSGLQSYQTHTEARLGTKAEQWETFWQEMTLPFLDLCTPHRPPPRPPPHLWLPHTEALQNRQSSWCGSTLQKKKIAAKKVCRCLGHIAVKMLPYTFCRPRHCYRLQV